MRRNSWLPILVACLLVIAEWCSAETLRFRPLADDPPGTKATRAFAMSAYGVDIGHEFVSNAYGYFGNADTYDIYSCLWLWLDRSACRLLYQDLANSPLMAFGRYGFPEDGDSCFRYPSAVECNNIVDDPAYANYYYIYIADYRNSRIRQINYDWVNQVMYGPVDLQACNLYRPVDIDFNNHGTFDWAFDDFLVVLSKHCVIDVINANAGTCIYSFGSEGSGPLQFKDPTSVACGRYPFSYEPYDPFANDRFLYVADTGNERVVLLLLDSDVMGVSYVTEWSDFRAGTITDLDVDPNGHLWASSSLGVVLKFTSYSVNSQFELITQYGSSGQFNNPKAIDCVAGNLGCGEFWITEDWTDISGGQMYGIGTDLQGLSIGLIDEGGICKTSFVYNIIDPSSMTVRIYDSADQLVRTVFDGNYWSGWHINWWDGRNDAGYLMPEDDYRVEITATAMYFDAGTGEPVDTTVLEQTFHYDCSMDFCTTGPGSMYGSGDCSPSGAYDVDDIVCMVGYLYQGDSTWCPPYSVDPNRTRIADIDDAVFLIAYVFQGGPEPASCEEWVTYFGEPDCE